MRLIINGTSRVIHFGLIKFAVGLKGPVSLNNNKGAGGGLGAY